MSWFRKKKPQVDLELEFAKFFLAHHTDPARRRLELDQLIKLLSVLDVRLYYKSIRIGPKRLAAVAKEAAENFTTIAIAMNPEHQ